MKKIFLAAVGDISFHWASLPAQQENILSSVQSYWADCDIVIGNLEGPLLYDGHSVQGKCTLRSHPGWAKELNNTGVHLVSLANNHIMDYGPEGLYSSIEALRDASILFIGAGENQESALAPHYMSINGHSLAFLARSSVIVSSRCYASENSPGVAYLDLNETKTAIRECRRHANKVILIIHWGLEHYYYPSPAQRKLAREFMQAGADLIIGHHPHVLQGIERIDSGLVCYSLGNFIFNDIQWSLINEDGKQQGRTLKLTQDNRKGGVLRMCFSEKGIESYDFLPTFILSNGTVTVDNTLERKREFDRLTSRLQWPAYSLFWRTYSIRQEWRLRLKPLMQEKVTWAKLKRLRPKHFRQLLDRLRRSTKITVEKTTNPYE